LRRNLARFLQIYDTRLLNHTRAYAGIADAVAAARRRARVAVLTNKPTQATEAVLSGLGLRTLFADVIGGDGAWPRKPDPASLRELMARAGADPPHTLVVGDSAIDHETAMRAGARCCLAAYGFGYETFPAERLSGMEWMVRAPSELPAVFDAFSAA
jgi:phosphoglycolate phosphatase